MKRDRKADLLLRERFELAAELLVEIVIWQVPEPVRGSAHGFKYRLALVDKGVCVLRYDNEAGKGDHRHVGARQVDYDFRGLTRLQDDFWDDVEEWLTKRMS